MFQNLVDYKAKSFLSERNSSSMAYEVKAVRALWDPSLSIPGTNRRGGWRCPVGTRYGGQITDRFGRQCGWGAARRIANMISDVGSRLERADDGKRGRRIARREQRMIRRLAGTGNGAGRIERGLRGVAERLDGGDSSTNVPSLNAPSVDRRVPSIRTPEAPRELTPARPAPGARVRRPNPNLRDSEARRMEREIAEPGAPRTGDAPARPRRPARARRPRGENNLRESEQRRMDREIDQPGAPRTDESAVRPAPQPREVDPKLSKEEASDANASEDFAPYVNRKYDEYARNVRLLNENNKPAGMMTRRQWYAVNEDNLREAWGNAHGREAPRDFIPPTPRRRQRANRRRDAVVDTAKAPKARKVPKVEEPKAPARRPQPGNSDNAARSEELRQARSEAARQAAEVLANADRERAFAMDDPNEFANAFMPSIWNNIPPADRQEFRDQYRDEQGAIDDVLQDLEQRILDDEFGDPDDLRERIIINNQEIIDANKRLERDLQVLKDLEKPAPLERQGVIGQNRRDALSRIAVNARDRRRRELENDKFQEAIDVADANGSSKTPKSKKPKAPKAQIARLRADVAEAERNLDQMERNGARDVVMRKERARIDQLMIQIARLRDKRPRDSDGVLLTDQTPKPQAPAVPNAQDALGFDYIGRDRLERLFGAEAANAYESKLNKEIGRIGGDNLEQYKQYATELTPERLGQLSGDHIAEISNLKDKLRNELNDFSEVRNKPVVDDAYRKEQLRRVTNINAQLEKAKRAKKIIDDEINVRNARARANRNTTGSKTPAAPKAPAVPNAPAINPTEATVHLNNVPIGLRPAVRPSHKGVLEDSQKEIAGKQVLGRTGADAAHFAKLVDAITTAKRAEIAKANANRNKVLTSLLEDINAGVDINAIIPGGNKSRLQGVLESLNNLTAAEKLQITEANFERILDGQRRLINGNWEELAKLDPAGGAINALAYKTHLDTIAKLEKDIVRIENHFWLVKNAEEEVRKAKARKDQGLDRVPNEAVGTVVANAKIVSQFKDAINRRNNKLVKHLDQKHADGSPRPYEDMTPDKWRQMTPADKKTYLREAYSHKKIVGANGKFYSSKVTAIDESRGQFGITVSFSEITADGRVIRANIGRSSRTVYTGADPHVYNGTLFIDNPIDKGADIQTIYNQHAFLYLSKMGAKYAKVSAVQDGPFVWAKVGYKDGSKKTIRELGAFEKGLEFYERFGPGGIISSDKEYRQVKKMIEKTRQNPRGVYDVQDWIFAIDDTPLDPVRRNYIKDWYLRNGIVIGGGKLNFDVNEVGKNLGKPKAVKKARRPRAARPRARAARPAIVADAPQLGAREV